MRHTIKSPHRLFLTAALMSVLSCLPVHAQWYRLNNGSLSVGATGQFSKQLTDSRGTTGTYQVPFQNGAATYSTTISNQQQGTTQSVGFLTSLQWHPVAWAGIAVNYGFTHYNEHFRFDYAATNPAGQAIHLPTDMHEFTAAYQFHVRKLPLQPFVNVGGGAIDFAPNRGTNQFRGAGLLEVGWDIPVRKTRFGFRVAGRSLVYRAPNFYTPAISTRAWRTTVEPAVSTYYRF